MARNLVFSNYYMASLDLCDAFYLVPVHKSCRKFLRFEFLEILYQFTCLPFGLYASPFIFTKVMKPIMGLLRSQHFSSVIYLDDILCIRDVGKPMFILQPLGFIINSHKNNLIPSKRCKYLGFMIDSEKQIVEITDEKRLSLGKLVKDFMIIRVHTLREFSHLIGKLVTTCPGIDYGWLCL